MLDTSECTVEMSDGSLQELTANIIVESMFAQVDSEGHHCQLLQEITDHSKDRSSIPISDGMNSKRQNTVESSSFGSEFISLRIATEII